NTLRAPQLICSRTPCGYAGSPTRTQLSRQRQSSDSPAPCGRAVAIDRERALSPPPRSRPIETRNAPNACMELSSGSLITGIEKEAPAPEKRKQRCFGERER